MPTGRLAKWKILLTEFDIVYVTRMAIKAQALADHLDENHVDDEYQPLSTYFPDEEVNSIEMTSEDTSAWKLFFDGAMNAKGVGIGAILISPTDQHYPATARLRQLYQQRMARAYNKKVRPRNFEVGQLVLRRILPHHQEAKGKFAPNWKGPYIIRKLLPKGALYLGDIEGNDSETTVNADAVKRCNPKQPCKNQVQPKGNAQVLEIAMLQ
ncbi:uncharacterized protein [Nicotiana sylvestris]|uniref:uncharacterized protein n=1 Tax=Nicotiana sylvestris TaxID=4096 RepID=UPI00388C6706